MDLSSIPIIDHHAHSLLREQPHPSEDDVIEWMKGSLCRCTGYEGIRTAIRVAAEAGVA